MKTTIDRFGRVVVPKELRKRFGLAPGAQIEIDEHDQELVIRRVTVRSPLQTEEGLLVFEGEAAGDLASWVRDVRENRISKVSAGA